MNSSKEEQKLQDHSSVLPMTFSEILIGLLEVKSHQHFNMKYVQSVENLHTRVTGKQNYYVKH